MKTVLQAIRKAILTTLALIIVSFSTNASDVKPQKLASDIYYSGNIVKKEPVGDGELFIKLQNDFIPLMIKGTFQNNIVLKGQYSNVIEYNEEWPKKPEQKMTTVLTFDSLQYNIDKKQQTLSMRIWGAKFNASSKLTSPSYIDIAYKLGKESYKNKKIWEVVTWPSYLKIDVSGNDISMGAFSYTCTSKMVKQTPVNSYGKSGYSNYFEPLSIECFTLDKINQPITINFANGMVTTFDGKNFTTKYGENTISGTYEDSRFAYSEITLQNDNYEAKLIYGDNVWAGKIRFPDGSNYIGGFRIKNPAPTPSSFGGNLLTAKIERNQFDYIAVR